MGVTRETGSAPRVAGCPSCPALIALVAVCVGALRPISNNQSRSCTGGRMGTTSSLGMWWLPGSPAEKVAGTLKYSDDDGAELSLAGTLAASEWGAVSAQRVPVILGVAAEA